MHFDLISMIKIFWDGDRAEDASANAACVFYNYQLTFQTITPVRCIRGADIIHFMQLSKNNSSKKHVAFAWLGRGTPDIVCVYPLRSCPTLFLHCIIAQRLRPNIMLTNFCLILQFSQLLCHLPMTILVCTERCDVRICIFLVQLVLMNTDRVCTRSRFWWWFRKLLLSNNDATMTSLYVQLFTYIHEYTYADLEEPVSGSCACQ